MTSMACLGGIDSDRRVISVAMTDGGSVPDVSNSLCQPGYLHWQQQRVSMYLGSVLNETANWFYSEAWRDAL